MTSTLLYDQGPAASRPAAGIKGRIYNPTDESGVLYKDDGVDWVRVPWQAFSPVSVGWHSSFWAEDPNWTPPADGGAVAQWDDASGNARHATQGTASQQPLYRASVAALGGQPAIDFDGSDDFLVQASFTALSTFTIVAVGREGGSGDRAFFDGLDTSHAQRLESRFGTTNYDLYNGGVISGGARDGNAHLFIVTFAGTDVVEKDGINILSGDAGTHPCIGLTLGHARSGNLARPLDGELAFVGLRNGTLTQQEKDDLLDWSRSHYGTP